MHPISCCILPLTYDASSYHMNAAVAGCHSALTNRRRRGQRHHSLHALGRVCGGCQGVGPACRVAHHPVALHSHAICQLNNVMSEAVDCAFGVWAAPPKAWTIYCNGPEMAFEVMISNFTTFDGHETLTCAFHWCDKQSRARISHQSHSTMSVIQAAIPGIVLA